MADNDKAPDSAPDAPPTPDAPADTGSAPAAPSAPPAPPAAKTKNDPVTYTMGHNIAQPAKFPLPGASFELPQPPTDCEWRAEGHWARDTQYGDAKRDLEEALAALPRDDDAVAKAREAVASAAPNVGTYWVMFDAVDKEGAVKESRLVQSARVNVEANGNG